MSGHRQKDGDQNLAPQPRYVPLKNKRYVMVERDKAGNAHFNSKLR